MAIVIPFPQVSDNIRKNSESSCKNFSLMLTQEKEFYLPMQYTLATTFGVLESMLITKLNYFINQNFTGDEDELIWICCSYSDWYFELQALWPKNAIYKALKKLVTHEIFYAELFEETGGVKCYTINYEKINSILSQNSKNNSHKTRNT